MNVTLARMCRSAAVALLGLVLAAGQAAAQDEAAGEKEPLVEVLEEEAAESEDADAEAAQAEEPEPRESPERFIPTEEIWADSALSFPVDI